MRDWKVFRGVSEQHDDLYNLPPPPPWRFTEHAQSLQRPKGLDLHHEAARAQPFLPTVEMVLAVNAALYLRRPLLITGKPGTGKSTLIAKVAHELRLGPVVRWPINSRSTVRGGIYDYDAVGRLQAGSAGDHPIEDFLKLGPLGTALAAQRWPRPLLIDELDKSDLDFANDLLNVIEEGEYEIPELRRLGIAEVVVRDYFSEETKIVKGRIRCGQFPVVVMTSNAEREFPPAFLRRCIRLNIEPPSAIELAKILDSHLGTYSTMHTDQTQDEVRQIIDDFDRRRQSNQDVATDQLLNAVFLTMTLKDGATRSFSEAELIWLQETLLRHISGTFS
jgi:MoxR-like ATPase